MGFHLLEAQKTKDDLYTNRMKEVLDTGNKKTLSELLQKELMKKLKVKKNIQLKGGIAEAGESTN